MNRMILVRGDKVIIDYIPFEQCTGQEYLLLTRPLLNWGLASLIACVPSFSGSWPAPSVS